MSRTNNSINWKDVREALVRRRTALFKRFVTDSANIRLAAEVKQLDDQILECTDQEREAHNSDNRKSGPFL